MPLNYVNRLNQLKEILSDLYSIINQEFDKKTGYATAFVFNNLFEECWKLMNELLTIYYGYSSEDYTIKGPSKTLSTAKEVGLIESDIWKKMLLDRNNTTRDYRSQNLENYFYKIKNEYIFLIEELVIKSDSIIKELNN